MPGLRSGAGRDRGRVGRLDRAEERLQPLRVLHARRGLGAAGGVDRPRIHGGDRLAHVVRVQAAGQHERGRPAVPAGQIPIEALARAAAVPLHVGVEQVEVGREGAQPVHRRGVADTHRLHHPAAGAARSLAAVGRALVAVQLQQAERAAVGQSGHLVQGRVHEHAGHLGLAPQRLADLLGHFGRAGSRAVGPEDHAQRPRAEPRSHLGVLAPRYAADLDLGHGLRVRRIDPA